QGHEKVVKLLLDYGDNIDVTFNGYNALDFARYYGYKKIVKLLEKYQKKQIKTVILLYLTLIQSKIKYCAKKNYIVGYSQP
ncbi:hypothetical protein DID75_05960, partial [Candidatus Marinamargulisbacteria bacterium SCGC AG-410-N11]